MYYCLVNFFCFNYNSVINNCQSGPCQNGGTCYNAVNSYTCSCASGYQGSQSQTGKRMTF